MVALILLKYEACIFHCTDNKTLKCHFNKDLYVYINSELMLLLLIIVAKYFNFAISKVVKVFPQC